MWNLLAAARGLALTGVDPTALALLRRGARRPETAPAQDRAQLPALPDPHGGDIIRGAVDVVIPMRNGAATIARALASIAAQTRPPRRIIVVDDGSTDDGPALAAAHPHVDVMAAAHAGASAARNTGVQASRAEFVAFLDCDDYWLPAKLERQMAVMTAQDDIAIVTGDHSEVLPDGTPIAETLYAPRFRGYVFQPVLDRNFDLGGWCSSMLVRRQSFLAAGGFDEGLRFAEDIDLCMRLARDHVFDFCPQVLTHVVHNPASATRRNSDPARDLLIARQYLSVIDRWIDHADRPGRMARRSLLYILSRTARGRLQPMPPGALRRRLLADLPSLSRHIARSDGHFAASLVLCAILRFADIVNAVRREALRALLFAFSRKRRADV